MAVSAPRIIGSVYRMATLEFERAFVREAIARQYVIFFGHDPQMAAVTSANVAAVCTSGGPTLRLRRERAPQASHAKGARRRSGARKSVSGSPRGDAPRRQDE